MTTPGPESAAPLQVDSSQRAADPTLGGYAPISRGGREGKRSTTPRPGHLR